MDDSAIYREFLELRESMQEGFNERHRALRSDMNAGFDKICAKMDAHIKDDDAVARRVDKMETQRESEEKQVAKRTTLIAMVAGIAPSIVMWVWDKLGTR